MNRAVCKFSGVISVGAAVAVVMSAGAARADCEEGRIDRTGSLFWSAGAGRDYDPFDPVAYVQRETIDVRLRGACDFFIGISPGRSGNYGDRRLRGTHGTMRYRFHDSPAQNNVLKDEPGANPSEVLTGAVLGRRGPGGSRGGAGPGGFERVSLDYYWAIEPLQVVPGASGDRFRDTVDFTLYEGRVGTGRALDRVSVPVEVRVMRVLDLSLVRTGAPFSRGDSFESIDFGSLRAGDRRGFDLVVRSNTAFRIAMASENGARMVNDDPSDPSAVRYSVRVNGAPVAVGGGADIAGGVEATPVEGKRYTIDVQIGDVTGVSAGTYRDSIIVSLIAR